MTTEQDFMHIDGTVAGIDLSKLKEDLQAVLEAEQEEQREEEKEEEQVELDEQHRKQLEIEAQRRAASDQAGRDARSQLTEKTVNGLNGSKTKQTVDANGTIVQESITFAPPPATGGGGGVVETQDDSWYWQQYIEGLIRGLEGRLRAKGIDASGLNVAGFSASTGCFNTLHQLQGAFAMVMSNHQRLLEMQKQEQTAGQTAGQKVPPALFEQHALLAERLYMLQVALMEGKSRVEIKVINNGKEETKVKDLSNKEKILEEMQALQKDLKAYQQRMAEHGLAVNPQVLEQNQGGMRRLEQVQKQLGVVPEKTTEPLKQDSVHPVLAGVIETHQKHVISELQPKSPGENPKPLFENFEQQSKISQDLARGLSSSEPVGRFSAAARRDSTVGVQTHDDGVRPGAPFSRL